jgi:hypothetical protein
MSTERIARALTPGELRLARHAFGDAIDYGRVTLRRDKWWWLQPAWVVMAPDGDIWFHPNGHDWSDDFSAARPFLKGLFIHEMTHVWQVQQGINLVVRRGILARYDYLPLVPGKPFAAYGLEQQAEIVKDAFLKRLGMKVPGAPPLADYDAILPFMPQV